MRLLLLPGAHCTSRIWDRLRPYLKDYEIDAPDYPHDITTMAERPEAIAEWVYECFHDRAYRAVIGHSLGGILALLLAHDGMNLDRIVLLDTNLKPAGPFYRNLMTPAHMETLGDLVLPMLREEGAFYNPALRSALQESFDYTGLLRGISQPVWAIYGDRGVPDYADRMQDLLLPEEALQRMILRFVPDACHMMMLENPEGLHRILREVLRDE